MKASLFLLFVFFAVAFCGKLVTREYQQQCKALQCEKSEEACGFVNLQTSTVSTACINADTEYCNITQTGNGVEVGTCLAYATLGQSCLNRQCGLGLEGCPGSTLTTTCVAAPQSKITRGPGQACGSSSIECYFFGTLGVEDVCNSGVCKFTPDGSTCTNANQCNYKSRCVSGSGLNPSTCQARFAAGSACIANITGSDPEDADDSNDQCADELNCMPTSTTDGISGVCRAIFSQKEDAPCKDDNDCKDGVCAAVDGAVGTVYWGVCADYKKTSTLNKRCADSSDCTASNGEYCVCVDDEKSVCKNTNYDREYYDENKDYEECREAAEEKCGVLEPKDSLKCYLTECKKDICKLYKVAKKEGPVYDFMYGIAGSIVGAESPDAMCAIVQVCDASSLFTSLPLLVAFAAIVLLLQ